MWKSRDIFIFNNLSVVWDSCACSDDGLKQIAVGFKSINSVYDCYIFLTKDAWATYTTTKITRRIKTINSVNYGVDEPFNDISYQGQKLKKDLIKQQKEIQDKNKVKFSPGIVIPNNPDSTYKKIKTE